MASWRPSLPLLWLSLAFLCGLGLGAWLGGPVWLWAALTVLTVGAVFIERRLTPNSGLLQLWRRVSPLPVSLLLAGALAGGLRWQAAQPIFSPADAAFYNGRGMVQLTGWVSAEPAQSSSGRKLQLTAESLLLADQTTAVPVRGRVEIFLPPGGSFTYGQRLRLEGELDAADEAQPPVFHSDQLYSRMNYPLTQQLDGRRGSALMGWLYAWRAQLQQVIQRSLPLPESALLEGVVLGIDQNLPQDTQQAFRQTGVAHIVAVSGFNVAVIAGIFVLLLSRGRVKRWGQAAALLGVVVYTLLTGAQPPAVRAAVLAGMGILAAWVGRSQSTANSLGLAAAGMAVLDPGLPWNASFQLSFTATLGLALLAGPWQEQLESRLEAGRLPGWVKALIRFLGEPLLVTAAAQIASLPVLLYLFHSFSLTALLANLLILPPQPLIMILGGLAALAGWVWYPLGQVLAGLTWPLLAYTIRAAELLGGVPVLSLGPFPGWLALLCYVLGGLVYLLRGRLFGSLRRAGWTAGMAGLMLLAALAWRTALLRPDGAAHLWFFGGEEAPALYLQTPLGRTYLINAPDSSQTLQDLLGRQLPPLEARLDGLLLVTNRAAGLRSAAQAMGRTPAGRAFLAPLELSSRSAAALVERLQLLKVTPATLRAGQTLELEPDLRLRLANCSASACALVLEVEGTRVWLPGGVFSSPDVDTQAALLSAADLEAAPGLLGRISPSLLLWSGAAPAPELPNGAAVIPLAGLKWVELTLKDGQMWVEVTR